MLKFFVPEYRFNSFRDITAEFLVSIGVKGVVLDIDNTLLPYEIPTPTEEVKEWLESLKKNGISASLVSNNNKERVELFNNEIGLPAFSKAGKPFKKNVLRALSEMGVSADCSVLIGDQVFTDVWAAHNAGIRAILVPPIKDKTDLLTRFKRWLEIPVLRMYDKMNEGE